MMNSRLSPQRTMLRLLVILVMSFSACAAGQAQSTNEEIHFRATVQAVIPLTGFSGQVTRLDADPRFALTMRVATVEPVVEEFVSGAVVTFAIHSPSLLFAGEPRKGGTYNFYLSRKTDGEKVRFFGLKVENGSLVTTGLTPHTGHGKCAENNKPVGYPLKGWVGFTNTGESVADMTVKALASPGKSPVATAKTDNTGRFSFPTLGPGRFYLRATKKLVGATVSADAVVKVGKGNNRIACLVAEGEATGESSLR